MKYLEIKLSNYQYLTYIHLFFIRIKLYNSINRNSFDYITRFWLLDFVDYIFPINISLFVIYKTEKIKISKWQV